MKTLYVKVALLGVIGVMHSASVCMLQSAKTKFDKKATKKAAEVVRAIIAEAKEAPLALPAQRPPVEPNFFTGLPKEVRILCVPYNKPNRDIPFSTRYLDLCREGNWLGLQLSVSSTCMSCRERMLLDNPPLAHYIRRCNYGIRLEPTPTAALKIGFERGLTDKSGLRTWHNDKTEYERSHEDSILSYQVMDRERCDQENQKCSIQ